MACVLVSIWPAVSRPVPFCYFLGFVIRLYLTCASFYLYYFALLLLLWFLQKQCRIDKYKLDMHFTRYHRRCWWRQMVAEFIKVMIKIFKVLVLIHNVAGSQITIFFHFHMETANSKPFHKREKKCTRFSEVVLKLNYSK